MRISFNTKVIDHFLEKVSMRSTKQMKRKLRISFLPLIALLVFTASSISVADESSSVARVDAAGPCTRFAAGSVVNNPPDLFSKNGVLKVNLSYNTETDAEGRILYCFTTPDGTESPTLHVFPGDRPGGKRHQQSSEAFCLRAAMRMEHRRRSVRRTSMGPAFVNFIITAPILRRSAIRTRSSTR